MAEASVSPKPFSSKPARAPKLASSLVSKLDSPPATEPESPLLDLVDSHAHIDATEFDPDRDDMLARARRAGVEAILAIGGGGADPASLATSMPFAERHDWIYAAAGIHPHEAQLATPAHYDALSRLASHPRFLAWGEIGLDYHYDHSPRDVQQRVFIEQLGLARAARPSRDSALPRRLARLPGCARRALAQLRDSAAFSIASPALSTRPGAELRWDSWYRLPATSHFPKRRTCAMWPRRCRWNRFSSKPIRHFWRRSRTADGETSPPSSPR